MGNIFVKVRKLHDSYTLNNGLLINGHFSKEVEKTAEIARLIVNGVLQEVPETMHELHTVEYNARVAEIKEAVQHKVQEAKRLADSLQDGDGDGFPDGAALTLEEMNGVLEPIDKKDLLELVKCIDEGQYNDFISRKVKIGTIRSYLVEFAMQTLPFGLPTNVSVLSLVLLRDAQMVAEVIKDFTANLEDKYVVEEFNTLYTAWNQSSGDTTTPDFRRFAEFIVQKGWTKPVK